VSSLAPKATMGALVFVVLAAVWSSAGAGAQSIGGNDLPLACSSLGASFRPVRAVPGSAGSAGPYSVLRRPQGTADVLPPAGGDFATLATYDPAATRLVFTTGVARVYLVRGHLQRLRVSGACLSRLPRALARVVRRAERQFAGQATVCFSLDQTRQRSQGRVEQNTSTSCVPPVAGTGGYALATVEGSSALTVGLVPDGVARVDVRFRTGRTVPATVRSNVVAYRPPALRLKLGGAVRPGAPRVVARRIRRLERRIRHLLLASIPAQITWRDARGQVLQTFTPPPALLRDPTSGSGSMTTSTTSGSGTVGYPPAR